MKPWSYVLILLLICLQIKKLRVRIIKQLSQVTHAQIMVESSHSLNPGLSSSKCKPLPGHACFPEAKLLPSRNFSSVTQSCLTLCNPINRSTPGLPVHHQLPEFTQTHIHSNAIQPSHPRSSPSPPAPNPSQHHSLFQ